MALSFTFRQSPQRIEKTAFINHVFPGWHFYRLACVISKHDDIIRLISIKFCKKSVTDGRIES